ncbi:Uu.00g097380.m01.CDS01 [Anthostomella pinea]|uniref:Uu.00g097380.m01.CDS01 n=1 Tax=Anthostomella pinea TaxID=933095 RepID=A0AAI8VCA4_9PEZI|nr:Uu.00g097380.m01.CDS01 [Anthostomella pinea]
MPRPEKSIVNPLQGPPFTDHTGRRAISAYWGKRPRADAPILPPQWSFQFYVTSGATTDSAPELPERLLAATRKPVLDSYPIRLDVIFMPGADTNELLDAYHEGRAHFNLLVQVEAEDWEIVGATVVSFDLKSDYHDEAEPSTNIERNVQWGDLKAASGRGVAETRFVGELLHDTAGASGQDEMNNAYYEKLEQGRSDWA